MGLNNTVSKTYEDKLFLCMRNKSITKLNYVPFSQHHCMEPHFYSNYNVPHLHAFTHERSNETKKPHINYRKENAKHKDRSQKHSVPN